MQESKDVAAGSMCRKCCREYDGRQCMQGEKGKKYEGRQEMISEDMMVGNVHRSRVQMV